MAFLNIDLRCPKCRYNLRGLEIGNRCPECGLNVFAEPGDAIGRGVENLDRELAEQLQLQEDDAARRLRLDTLINSWEERGDRFNRLLDRMEEVLKKIDGECERR